MKSYHLMRKGDTIHRGKETWIFIQWLSDAPRRETDHSLALIRSSNGQLTQMLFPYPDVECRERGTLCGLLAVRKSL